MPMGGIELIVVLAILLLLFGAKRVPQLARSLGVGARELKKAASEEGEEETDGSETATASEGVDGGGSKKASEDPRSEREGARGNREDQAQ
jgi:sec-independent protein translocase protein TatA